MTICVHKDLSTTDICYSSLCVYVCAKSLQLVATGVGCHSLLQRIFPTHG